MTHNIVVIKLLKMLCDSESIYEKIHKINKNLKDSIEKFQTPFDDISRLLIDYILDRLGCKNESDLDLKKFTVCSEGSNFRFYSYDDSVLGWTKLKMFNTEIYSIESSKIRLVLSITPIIELTTHDDTKYIIEKYNDFSGVKIKINDHSYVNSRCALFGKGEYADCYNDKLLLSLANKNYMKVCEKFGISLLYPKSNNEEQHKQITEELGIEQSISWKNTLHTLYNLIGVFLKAK